MMAALICLTCFFYCTNICVYLSNNFFNLFLRSVYFFIDIFNISKLSSKQSNLKMDLDAELTKVGHFGFRYILVGPWLGVVHVLFINCD